MSYSGRCFGGPYDGQSIAAESTTLELWKLPPVPLSQLDEQKKSNETGSKLGVYRWTSVFIWESSEPPAPDVLSLASAPASLKDQAGG